MTERVAKLTVLLGTNGCGKTTTLRQILHKLKQRCLVITAHDLEWDDVQTTELETKEDYLFEGIRRHIWSDDTMKRIQKFKKGIIVFDDCRMYFRDQTSPELRQLMIGRRQREVDLFAVGHGFTEVPPVFFTFMSDLILFQTKDNILKRKSSIRDFPAAQAAQERVNKKAQTNRHHFEIIKFV